MKTLRYSLPLLVGLVLLAAAPARAANKDMIQLQTQVQALQDAMARMQQSFDERMGVMKNLIDQTTDNINRMNQSLDGVTKTLQQQSTDQGSKVDQVSAQIQALHDSVDELKARMAKVGKQLDDIQAAQQNIQSLPAGGAAPAGSPQQPAAQSPQTMAPPADVLYNNALRDYNAAKYDLAIQEFGDYLKFYNNTDLAGNAQFYLADIEYRQGNYPKAIQDYDKVLEEYPGGNKAAAAQLKKGYALLNVGQRDAGTRELRSLIARYPRSLEAQQAKDRLRQLGAAPTASKPSPGRRRSSSR